MRGDALELTIIESFFLALNSNSNKYNCDMNFLFYLPQFVS